MLADQPITRHYDPAMPSEADTAFGPPDSGVLSTPQVRLGEVRKGGVAPAIMAIVERGVRRRPALASAIRAEIEINLEEGYPPIRIVFGEHVALVEDGAAVAPGLRVDGSLPDLISLMIT